jgi:histidinol dehydrogenase
MKSYILKDLNEADLRTLCKRPAITFDSVLPMVRDILEDVRRNGDVAILSYEAKFGGAKGELLVNPAEVVEACDRIPKDVKRAFEQAARNIETFHKAQLKTEAPVETMPGVTCFAEMRGIERVGLYIPGGTAPLPSTVLMLAIPAKLAGCKEIVLCTPSKSGQVPDIILYAARLCGVTKIFKIGGAQAIAAMAYGTQTLPKTYKIFGPGNQYVTAAKMLASIDPDGTAIDMPAGPSEVLVVAGGYARADFVAADLLAQAEHGTDSQVVLVSNNQAKIDEVLVEVQKQLQTLPRKDIAAGALKNSFALLAPNLTAALGFSNRYAPEHLILNTKDAKKLIPQIMNAGSVFVGPYSCESAGDYASGTNHSLPTYGYARAYSGVSVASFQKRITFQQVTKRGAVNIGLTVATMAAEEGLDAHKRAMELRYKSKAEVYELSKNPSQKPQSIQPAISWG